MTRDDELREWIEHLRDSGEPFGPLRMSERHELADLLDSCVTPPGEPSREALVRLWRAEQNYDLDIPDCVKDELERCNREACGERVGDGEVLFGNTTAGELRQDREARGEGGEC